MEPIDEPTPDDPRSAAAPTRMRICVDLEGETLAQLEAVRERRHLSKSQAIRRAVALLSLVDDDRYELILRDREGDDPDRSIVLIP